MKIITWNLERPRLRSPKNSRRIERILESEPDIALLTETHEAIDLGRGYKAVSTAPSPRKPREGEAVAAIWFRTDRYSQGRRFETTDPREAVCVELLSPQRKIMAYASIIPYHGYKGPNGASSAWEEHEKAIEWHRKDWTRLRREYPDHELVVGGDFNQARDGVGQYGNADVRCLLTDAFKAAELTCVTEEDFVASGKLAGRHSVDHICLSSSLAEAVCHVDAWEGTEEGVKLSDHNGVAVEIGKT